MNEFRSAWECPRCHRINAPHVDYCACNDGFITLPNTPNIPDAPALPKLPELPQLPGYPLPYIPAPTITGADSGNGYVKSTKTAGKTWLVETRDAQSSSTLTVSTTHGKPKFEVVIPKKATHDQRH